MAPADKALNLAAREESKPHAKSKTIDFQGGWAGTLLYLRALAQLSSRWLRQMAQAGLELPEKSIC